MENTSPVSQIKEFLFIILSACQSSRPASIQIKYRTWLLIKAQTVIQMRKFADSSLFSADFMTMKGKILNSFDLVISRSNTFIRGASHQQWNNAKFVKIYGFHFQMTWAELSVCRPIWKNFAQAAHCTVLAVRAFVNYFVLQTTKVASFSRRGWKTDFCQILQISQELWLDTNISKVGHLWYPTSGKEGILRFGLQRSTGCSSMGLLTAAVTI